MNLKKFSFKKWKEGILNLSIEQQLNAKIWLFVGGAFGMVLATITFIIRGSWGFAIFLFCMVGLQVISAIGTRQQIIQYKKQMEEINRSEESLTEGINNEFNKFV